MPMEGGVNGVHGGRFPSYVNLQKQPLVPPPLTAIGRFLQGQSSQNKYSLHNFEKNKGTFISPNGVYGFSSSSNGRIVGLYDESQVSLVSNVPMNKLLATNHGGFTKNYQSIERNNDVIKFGKTIKMKGGGRKNLIKGQWTDEEDRKLCRLVKQHGVRKWAHIAEQMIGRAGKQCRERWHNHLRPDIKKDTWSENEERMLIEVHQKVGNKWAEIAKVIPGRTENAIKNHWNATKRRQNSRSKIKKNESKNRKPQSSILQEYIRSKKATNEHNVASTITTPNATSGSSTTTTTTSFDDPYFKLKIDFIEEPYPTSNDSPSLDITQSYDDELTFMQSFFADRNHIRQDSNTTSNESSIHIKDPKSSSNININPLGFNNNPHYSFSPYNSSISNESAHIQDLKSSLEVKPLSVSGSSQYGFVSSSSISNESSLQISPKSSIDMFPLGFGEHSLYGFDSSSSIHGEDSNLYLNGNDSSKSQLAPDVYISYILEGSTTLCNSSEHVYYEDAKRDLVFEAEKGSSDCSSKGNNDMDLVEMVLSSQFS